MTQVLSVVRRAAAFALIALAAALVAGAPLRVTAKSAAAPPAQDASQTPANRAALVVQYAEGDVETVCVSFTDPVIYGDDVLQLAGIDGGIATDGRICSIDGVGCAPNDCWCQCTDLTNCTFWAYYHLQNGAWQFSDTGATNTEVTNGAVEGWSWGKGAVLTGGTPPPVYTFDQICPAGDGATATPTLTPTATPSPTATSTLEGQAQTGATPQVAYFRAAPQTIASGSCASLEWSVLNASDVQIDGVPTASQGQQQVCPTASRTYSLVASSTGGSTTREVTVFVQGTVAGQQTATPSSTPTLGLVATPALVTPPALRTPSPGLPLRTPVVGGTSLPEPAAAQPFPTLSAAGRGQSNEGAAPQEMAVPAPTASSTPTPYRLARAPTSTPRPRRALVAGGPTPTPLLLARSDAAVSAAAPSQPNAAVRSTRGGSGNLKANRAFRAELLPGYATFLFMAASLAVMAVWVARRKTLAREGASPRGDGRPLNHHRTTPDGDKGPA